MNELVKELTDQAGQIPDDQKLSVIGWRLVAKYLIPVVFTIVLIIPGYTYFVANKAGDQLFGTDIPSAVRFYTLFRLFGLYAFTFIWGQLMLGPFMGPLNRLYGRNWLYFHRAQGTFALLLAVLHPLILYTAYYLQAGIFSPLQAMANYVSSRYLIFAYLGLTAEVLLLITVGTALMMRKPWFRKKWRTIHLLNYAVFVLVFTHSYVLGSETQVAPLKYVYWFFGVTFVAAVLYRRVYVPLKK